MSSIEQTDKESAAHAKAPRVSLADIEGAIQSRYDFNALQIVANALPLEGRVITPGDQGPLGLLSVCFLVMKNGFVLVGKSAPASPENFNPELGKKFAYEDAVRQLWPLMGFELRQRLHDQAQA